MVEIIESAYDAIDTERAIERSVRVTKTMLYLGNAELPLDSIDKIVVIGAGKCSPLAACALEKILGKLISGGIVIGTKKRDWKEGISEFVEPLGKQNFIKLNLAIPEDGNYVSPDKMPEFINNNDVFITLY